MTNSKFEATKNGVTIWLDKSGEPSLIQPTWPSGEPWASDSEATAWAELSLKVLADPSITEIPGDSPASPTKPRPAPPEIDPETGEPIVAENTAPAEPDTSA